MPFIVAHEFFDALPIHAFQGVEVEPPQQSDKPATTARYDKQTPSKDGSPNRVWRELVVSPVPIQPKLGLADPEPEFQLSISKEPTRHSQSLPLSSVRYKQLKTIPSAILEICPDASLYAADFAARIGGSSKFDKRKPSGAALIIDYGPKDTVPVNSLRGIRRHRQVNPFAEPGLVDLSADVDFTAVAQAATRTSEGIEVWGPVEQEVFLKQMGVRQRAEQLMKGVDEGRAKEIDAAWKRLVDPGTNGMGRIYKAIAIVPDEDGKHPPAGFGRDLAAEEGH
jgi:SAM-dependent MidA family methyltransferase